MARSPFTSRAASSTVCGSGRGVPVCGRRWSTNLRVRRPPNAVLLWLRPSPPVVLAAKFQQRSSCSRWRRSTATGVRALSPFHRAADLRVSPQRAYPGILLISRERPVVQVWFRFAVRNELLCDAAAVSNCGELLPFCTLCTRDQQSRTPTTNLLLSIAMFALPVIAALLAGNAVPLNGCESGRGPSAGRPQCRAYPRPIRVPRRAASHESVFPVPAQASAASD